MEPTERTGWTSEHVGCERGRECAARPGRRRAGACRRPGGDASSDRRRREECDDVRGLLPRPQLRVVLLDASRIEAIHNTDHGPVVDWRCWCGTRGTWSAGRPRRRRTGDTVVGPSPPAAPARAPAAGSAAALARRTPVRSAAASSARTPGTTSTSWLRRGSAHRLCSEPQAPALGSAAPNTTWSTRAATSAPAHIGHGSSVTTSVVPSRRHAPTTSAGVAQGQHLGVRGRVAELLALVVALGDRPRRRAARRRPTGTSSWSDGLGRFVEREAHGGVEIHDLRR